jgi:hypothetical protein
MLLGCPVVACTVAESEAEHEYEYDEYESEYEAVAAAAREAAPASVQSGQANAGSSAAPCMPERKVSRMQMMLVDMLGAHAGVRTWAADRRRMDLGTGRSHVESVHTRVAVVHIVACIAASMHAGWYVRLVSQQVGCSQWAAGLVACTSVSATLGKR